MSAETEGRRIEEAVGYLRSRIAEVPSLAVVLGSGLAGLRDALEDPVAIPFAQVPHWPEPRVAGHRADLVVGRVGSRGVALLAGRVHLYEGFWPAEVVRAVRSLRHLGVRSFLLTNAAGGIDTAWRPGDLMIVSDHINLTGSSPLCGPAEPVLGPRFPDQSQVYSPRLRGLLAGIDRELREGVYAGMLGPAYETPAEVRMLAALGAGAVGMSTVHEAMALHAMGAEVAALSLISNLAAGLAPGPLAHEAVLEAGRRASARLLRIVTASCAQI